LDRRLVGRNRGPELIGLALLLGGTCIDVRMLRTCSARARSSFGNNGGRFGSTFIAGKLKCVVMDGRIVVVHLPEPSHLLLDLLAMRPSHQHAAWSSKITA
jgi:hypothetical protein